MLRMPVNLLVQVDQTLKCGVFAIHGQALSNLPAAEVAIAGIKGRWSRAFTLHKGFQAAQPVAVADFDKHHGFVASAQ